MCVHLARNRYASHSATSATLALVMFEAVFAQFWSVCSLGRAWPSAAPSSPFHSATLATWAVRFGAEPVHH